MMSNRGRYCITHLGRCIGPHSVGPEVVGWWDTADMVASCLPEDEGGYVGFKLQAGIKKERREPAGSCGSKEHDGLYCKVYGKKLLASMVYLALGGVWTEPVSTIPGHCTAILVSQ